MMQLDTTWVLAAGELYLTLLAGFFVLLFFHFRKRSHDRRAAVTLVSAIKHTEPERRATLHQWLQTALKGNEDAISRGLNEILRAEKILIQRVVSMYLKRDAVALSQFQADVIAVGEPLRKLATSGHAVSPAIAEELKHLQEENQTLRQELQITMETMSRMLGEYSAMFGGGVETREEAHTLNHMLDAQLDSSGSLDNLQEISPTDLSEEEWEEEEMPIVSKKGVDSSHTEKPLASTSKAPAAASIDDGLDDLWGDALSEQKHLHSKKL